MYIVNGGAALIFTLDGYAISGNLPALGETAPI
jgi:hypothetical protein